MTVDLDKLFGPDLEQSPQLEAGSLSMALVNSMTSQSFLVASEAWERLAKFYELPSSAYQSGEILIKTPDTPLSSFFSAAVLALLHQSPAELTVRNQGVDYLISQTTSMLGDDERALFNRDLALSLNVHAKEHFAVYAPETLARLSSMLPDFNIEIVEFLQEEA